MIPRGRAYGYLPTNNYVHGAQWDIANPAFLKSPEAIAASLMPSCRKDLGASAPPRPCQFVADSPSIVSKRPSCFRRYRYFRYYLEVQANASEACAQNSAVAIGILGSLPRTSRWWRCNYPKCISIQSMLKVRMSNILAVGLAQRCRSTMQKATTPSGDWLAPKLLRCTDHRYVAR